MITRLQIRGYKSLRNVDLRDLSRLITLFGPNASGKSNLLDALDLLAYLAKEDTLASAFQRHRGNRAERPLPTRWFFFGGDDNGESDREMAFEVDLELQELVVEELNQELAQREKRVGLDRPYTRVTQTKLRYCLVLRYSSASRSLDVVSESLEPLTKDGHAHRSVVPYIKVESPGRRLSVKLERQAHPRFYDLPRNRTLLAEVGDSVNHPHLVAVARELRSLRVYYVEPVRMRSAIADVEATDPGPHGEQLAAFYYWLQRRHPVVFRNLLHNLRRLVPSVRDLGVREGSEGFLELWVSEGDSREFPAALVSEGTLRLLSLLGIAATPQAPAIAGYEEPENGVNPARLEEMLRILANASAGPSGIQLFLTTHSPEVVNFFGDATRVLCSRRKGESVYEPMDNAPLFVSSLVQDALGGLSVRSAPLGERLRRGDLE